jgi:hypothetical protein
MRRRRRTEGRIQGRQWRRSSPSQFLQGRSGDTLRVSGERDVPVAVELMDRYWRTPWRNCDWITSGRTATTTKKATADKAQHMMPQNWHQRPESRMAFEWSSA